MKIFSAPNTAAALLVLGATMEPTSADYSVTVAAKTQLLGSWEGWGTSLAWWANVFGDRADIADMLFTSKDAVQVPSAGSLPALNFNIARYNVGGSGKNVINDSGKKVSMLASSKMPDFRLIDSFWLDWFNKDPASSSWNWKVDAKQRAMLLAAKQRGANLFEAFSNSPPWWMNSNHAVAGGKKGTDDNLQSWNQEDFALYLSAVVKHAKDNWGINFQYVEPFNEPISTWWTFPGTQEGCHFSIDAQKAVLLYLRKQLDKHGLQGVAITASDENTVDQALSTLTALSNTPAVTKTFTKVNTHGYVGHAAYRGKNRVPLLSLTKKLGMKLWDSEYGEADASGVTMAESIGLDINEMGVSAFVYSTAAVGACCSRTQATTGWARRTPSTTLWLSTRATFARACRSSAATTRRLSSRTIQLARPSYWPPSTWVPLSPSRSICRATSPWRLALRTCGQPKRVKTALATRSRRSLSPESRSRSRSRLHR